TPSRHSTNAKDRPSCSPANRKSGAGISGITSFDSAASRAAAFPSRIYRRRITGRSRPSIDSFTFRLAQPPAITSWERSLCLGSPCAAMARMASSPTETISPVFSQSALSIYLVYPDHRREQAAAGGGAPRCFQLAQDAFRANVGNAESAFGEHRHELLEGRP